MNKQANRGKLILVVILVILGVVLTGVVGGYLAKKAEVERTTSMLEAAGFSNPEGYYITQDGREIQVGQNPGRLSWSFSIKISMPIVLLLGVIVFCVMRKKKLKQ